MGRKDKTSSEWFDELILGMDFRKRYGLETAWNELEGMYYNMPETAVDKGPNIIASQGDSLLSQIATSKPTIMVSPRQVGEVETAPVVQALDSLLMDELHIRREVMRSFHHAYLWSTGIVKIGYDSEYGYDPIFDIGEGNPIGYTLTQFSKKGHQIEFNDIQPGMPWVRSCLPHDIVVPWGTIELEDAEWIAHRVVRHIDDIRDDIRYTNTKDLVPSMSMEDYMSNYTLVEKSYRTARNNSYGRNGRGKADYIEMFEIHDKRTGKVIVICPGYDKKLREEQNFLQIRGLPFASVSTIARTRSLWTTPEAFYLLFHQSEMIDIASTAKKQRWANILKFLVKEGSMKAEELEKILSPSVAVAAFVQNGELDKVIKAVNAGQPNLALYQDMDQIKRYAREASGQSNNQVGEYDSSSRRTATEAQIVSQSSGMRTNRKMMEVGDLYVNIFKLLNQVCFKFWKTPRVLEVLGEEAKSKWVSFTGPQISGNYIYKLEFSAERGDNGDARRQEAIMIYQALRMDPRVNPDLLIQYLVRKFNDPGLAAVFMAADQGGQNRGEGGQDANSRVPLQGVQQGGGSPIQAVGASGQYGEALSQL